MKSTQDSFVIAAFEGGNLNRLEGFGDGNEVVLALPLSRLIARMVFVPADADPVAVASPILQKASPFPDEELTVGFEVVRETEAGKVVVAAALPESAADDIAEALDSAKLNVTRIDALVLGALRGLWSQLGQDQNRRLILVRGTDCLSVVVIDGDGPSAIRAVSDVEDLRREVVLSLLEAEDFGGSRKLSEIVVVDVEGASVSGEQDGGEAAATDPFAGLAEFAPVRRIQVGSQAALMGVAERSSESSGLDALPASWREVLEESRFKSKLIRHLAVAGGLWLLVMGTLFGVPIAYGYMTDYQKGLSKQHRRQYQAVKEMRDKVDLIRKYSDHARGALEIMKALSDRLPEGVTLSSWNYKRDDGVTIVGDADSAEAVYKFKDVLDALMPEESDADAKRIFDVVELKGPNASKGKHHFELDCRYEKEGAE